VLLKKFCVIGAAGFVAPRHFAAIKEVGGVVDAIVDPSDSVGIIDQFFPNARYYRTDNELSDYLKEQSMRGCPIDYVVVCSPNYLHATHCHIGLTHNCNIICEKPLVVEASDALLLRETAKISGLSVNCIMQLRLNPLVAILRDEILRAADSKLNVSLRYVTPRGEWYSNSWKSDKSKSGGFLMNIGIHLFDLLIVLFGENYEILRVELGDRRGSGQLRFDGKVKVDWTLSVDESDKVGDAGGAERVIKINGMEYDLSEGFLDGHLLSYQRILNNRGYSIDDALPAIQLVAQLVGECE